MSLSLSTLTTSLSLLRGTPSFSTLPSSGTAASPAVLGLAALRAPSISVPKTSDPYVNGLLSGTKWSTPSLSYGFPETSSAYEYTGEAQNHFHALTITQRAAVERALHAYSSVANVTFMNNATAATADLRFAYSDRPSTAWAYTPTSSVQGGDVWFNYSTGNYADPKVGNYAYDTILHEVGHALGLKHAHETAGSMPTLPAGHQSMEYTVMSYSSYVGASTRSGYTNQSDSYAQTLMADDMAALQSLYGANFTTNADDTTYAWNPTTGEMSLNGSVQGAPSGNRVLAAIWDGGGNDTYDFTSYASDLKVDLNPGGWTTTSTGQLADLKYDGTKKAVGNIANARLYQKDARSLIENAIGGNGNDTISGNQGNNRLQGGAGIDTLKGGTGNDVLIGGTGTDLLDGGSGIDTVDFSGAAAGVSLSLQRGGTLGDAAGDTFRSIERVIGTAFADNVTGSSVADELLGGEGDDTIDGGAGNDRLSGGAGNDVLSGGAGSDTLTGGAGSDTFVFKSAAEIGKASGLRDAVADFTVAEDVIDLSSIDANTRAIGKQSFNLLADAGAAFTSIGQVRYRYETTAAGDRTIVEGNIDASLGADFVIELTGHITNLTHLNFRF